MRIRLVIVMVFALGTIGALGFERRTRMNGRDLVCERVHRTVVKQGKKSVTNETVTVERKFPLMFQMRREQGRGGNKGSQGTK